MASACTVTLLNGPAVVGDRWQATFNLACATTEATGYMTNSYKWGIVLPGESTSATSTNFVITAHYVPAASGDAENAQAFTACNAVALTGVTALQVTVRGKRAIPTSWA
jgi:hypothetical protein